VLIWAAQTSSDAIHVDPIALAWLLVPLVLLPSMALVLLIRPDPKVIAANLARYYPGYQPPPSTPTETSGPRHWLNLYPMRVGFLSMFAAHGIMTMMMALTPLAMAHSGHDLTMISIAVSMHVVGMFGLSLPLGRLADRVGRRNVIICGLLIDAFGALLVALTVEYWVGTLGIVLVGVGWSCVNVATTALIADSVPALERGRAIGVVDSFAGLASIVLPLAAGTLVELSGFGALAVVAWVLVLGPVMMAMQLREPRPGHYAYRGGTVLTAQQ
jgi:MFS family permease